MFKVPNCQRNAAVEMGGSYDRTLMKGQTKDRNHLGRPRGNLQARLDFEKSYDLEGRNGQWAVPERIQERGSQAAGQKTISWLRNLSLYRFLIGLLGCVLAYSSAANAASSPQALLAQGRVDDAISSLELNLSSSPNAADSYNLLCRAYFVVEDWDSAVRSCQKAVSLQPFNSQFHLWLGRAYGEKASHARLLSAVALARKVRSEFETAVRLDPENLEAHSDLAEFYLEAPSFLGGGKDKAEVQARELARLDRPEAEMVEAGIAERNNNLTGAENHLQAAVKLSKGRAGEWLALAEFYRRNAQVDKMQDALEHAVSAPNSDHLLMQAAEMLIHSRRNSAQAIALLRQYLSSATVEDAPVFKAHYLIGKIYEQEGNTTDATKEYRSALALAKDYAPAQSGVDRMTSQMASNVVRH
jgi:cytochrome c-type biogenesis protein CcmH/NrfG